MKFGQALPKQELELAVFHCKKADVFVSIGSSLEVTPAANLPRNANQNGAKLIIINRKSTPLDNMVDLVINEDFISVLPEIVANIQEKL